VKKIGVAECCEDVSWVGEKVKRLCKPVLSGKRADSATVDRQRAKQRGRRNRATSGIDTVRGQTVDERRAGKEREGRMMEDGDQPYCTEKERDARDSCTVQLSETSENTLGRDNGILSSRLTKKCMNLNDINRAIGG